MIWLYEIIGWIVAALFIWGFIYVATKKHSEFDFINIKDVEEDKKEDSK